MPSRIIRGEFNASESMASVSLEAELTFAKLILAVDDYGRIDARPKALRAALYPLRDEVTPDQVAGWVAELDADGCVALYEANGKPYLQLTGWEEHRGKGKRGKTSKCPAPNGERPPRYAEEPEESVSSADPRGSLGDPSGGRGTGDGGRGAEREAPDGAAPPGLALEGSGVSPNLVAKLGEHAPGGVTYSEPQRRAWALEKAAKARLTGKKNIRQTLLNWWPNATFDEVQAAVEARATRALEGARNRTPPPDPEDDVEPMDLTGGRLGRTH